MLLMMLTVLWEMGVRDAEDGSEREEWDEEDCLRCNRGKED